MKTVLKAAAGLVGVFLILTAAAICYYAYVVYPKLKPMLNHDIAINYSRILSQIDSHDLSALSIPQPCQSTPLSESDIRRLLQRLHDTGRFPEWKSNFKLMDYEGKLLSFFVRPKQLPDRQKVIGGLKSGDFVFAVKSSTMSEAVEYP